MMNLINAGKNDLFRFMVVVSLILLMIFFVIKLYIANKPTLDGVNYAMQQQNFTKTLSLIRGQWLIEGRPDKIEFSFHDNNNNVINTSLFKLSKLGWASIGDLTRPEYCRSLWTTINNLESQESEINSFIAAKHQKNDDIVCQICDAKSGQICVEYSIKTGIVYPENIN